MSSDAKPAAFPASSVRRELFLTKAAIVIIGLGVCLVGRRDSAWPIATWAMYSQLTPKFPPARVSIIELRVISARGHARKVSSIDLFPADRTELADRLFAHAFDDTQPKHRDADRIYLVHLLSFRIADIEIEEIQGWQVSWEVSALKLPPLLRDQPVEMLSLGTFAAKAYVQPERR